MTVRSSFFEYPGQGGPVTVSVLSNMDEKPDWTGLPSTICKPVRAAGTGAYGHRHGLRFSNPHPTRTRDAGMAGFVHECYLLNGY